MDTMFFFNRYSKQELHARHTNSLLQFCCISVSEKSYTMKPHFVDQFLMNLYEKLTQPNAGFDDQYPFCKSKFESRFY